MAGKRKIFSILVGLALLLFFALAAGCYWLMATRGGTAWLIRTAADHMPGSVVVQSVEGRLADEIILSGLKLRWEKGELAVGRLTWRWRTTGLLHRNLRIRTLRLEDVSLVTTQAEEQPQKPLDLTWPDLPGWLTTLNISLDDVQIRRFTLRQPDAQPFYLEGLATEVRWTRRKIRIPWFTALYDAGALTAKADIDWRRPGLRMRTAALVRSKTGTDMPLVLDLVLKPEKTSGILKGNLDIASHTPATGGMSLTTPFVLAPTILQLHDFELQSLFTTGSLRGKLDLDWAAPKPRLEVSADLKNLDLNPMAGQATNLSGRVTLSADPDTYAGQLALTNRGTEWRNLRLETAFSGDRQTVAFAGLKIFGLGGTIEGNGALRWHPQLHVRGEFNGRNLNPALAGLAWSGNINLQGEGSWSRPDDENMTVAMQARLLPSTLRGYPLRGQIEARLQGEDVAIEVLELHSRGVDLAASGRLRQRIDFVAEVDDLAGLVPELSGALQGRGWIRWRNKRMAGKLNGSGRGLHHDRLEIQDLRFAADLAQSQTGSLSVTMTGINTDGLEIPSLSLRGKGRLEQHSLNALLTLPRQKKLNLTASGGYGKSAWRGNLTRLTLRDATGTLALAAPTTLAVSRTGLSLAPLQLQGTSGENLTTGAEVRFSPLNGHAELHWNKLELAHLQPWLDGTEITGNSSGNASWKQSAKRDFQLRADLQAAGRLVRKGRQLELARAAADMSWTSAGLLAEMSADLKEGGRLEGRIQGGRSTTMTLPEKANWQLACRKLDLHPLTPWLPAGIAIKGILSGRSKGKLFANRQLTADGRLTVSGGEIVTDKEQGQITVPVQNAELVWNWRGEEFSGQTDLKLGEYGLLNGSFRLPLPARIPVEPMEDGTLNIDIEGRSSELGLLTALLPGAVQETRGRLEIELHGAGTWRSPEIDGRLRMLEAGAYLPVAGVDLQKVNFLARLDKDRILLESLSLQSGGGRLQGKGSLQLQDWKFGSYDITLKGQGVQLVNLPELQVKATPDLQLRGSASALKITGSVELPEVMIRDNKKPSVITPSKDVVIVGEQLPEKQIPDFHIQTDVRLLLGDHVLVQASGLDARLTGELRLTSIEAQALTAHGRISVAEGQYAAYGTRLDITRGNLLFNGPLDQPTLDIVALRTVGKVKAGVQVSGTPRVPVVKLTSDPAMSDSDRLAYIVLGRASARNAGEADLLMTAGGLLLSQGESVALRDQIKRQLGIDVLGFETGTATGQDEFTGSMLTIGKYLSPSLYVSIGQSLFANTQEFRLRYSLGKHWELESTTGEESGVDLFYKIEFQ